MAFLFSGLLGGLFGGHKKDAPQPEAVPASPSAADNEAAQRERTAAQDSALAQSRAAGRQQTVAAGRMIAEDDQQVLGAKSARRRAARDILG
jgi:hypothetical protein